MSYKSKKAREFIFINLLYTFSMPIIYLRFILGSLYFLYVLGLYTNRKKASLLIYFNYIYNINILLKLVHISMDKFVCTFCNRHFSTNFNMKRHLKTAHPEQEVIVETKRKNHIFCPICRREEPLGTYEKLNFHLINFHQVSINENNFSFSSKEDFVSWKCSQKIDVEYVVYRKLTEKEYNEVYYHCNRSNSKEYESACLTRTTKAGGLIKINGICPSRIIARFYNNGTVTAKYVMTHVGHKDELRSTHLSNNEKNTVVEKLKMGIPKERIIQDARKMESSKMERFNLLSNQDVANISRLNNVDQKRHQNDMIATALKVQEWNAHGQNYCFIFKPEGERHPILRDSDFALGYMNSTMEKKLNDFDKIICVDGTHGTNRKGMELTIILVKDDRNVGFPVAFFLSNRQDQIVHEVFLMAMKNKVNKPILPEYFMSDDDPKYYNAWIKIMDNYPRRLLCTWHVIKNWNIQGKAKIKDNVIKSEMKKEMRKILTETEEEKFVEAANNYLEFLNDNNELDFLNYLKKYYFQNEDRIQMWAHCYRVNAGINTNMALESLNNLLKTVQLKRKSNLTIEKLLDALDALVEGRMWQRILNMERPNSNSYHDKIVKNAHKLAETMKNEIKKGEFGEFMVKSSTGNNYYKVSYNELCNSDCRMSFCRVCNICVHRYMCECQQYAVKSTICKHVHLVCLYERREGGSFLDISVKSTQDEPNEIEEFHKKEIGQFVEETIRKDNEQENFENYRKICMENINRYLMTLDENSFKKQINKWTMDMESENKPSKRKNEKQSYYPTKKSKNNQ